MGACREKRQSLHLGPGPPDPGPSLCPYSPECVEGEFCEVRLSLPLGVCGVFFLDDLQALDHLEGEAHYAALLALVIEVDGLVIVVDDDLLHKPAVVVEAQSGMALFSTFWACSLIGACSFPR